MLSFNNIEKNDRTLGRFYCKPMVFLLPSFFFHGFGFVPFIQLPDGVYVREVVAGTAADQSGHFKFNDRVLEVRGRTVSYDRASPVKRPQPVPNHIRTQVRLFLTDVECKALYTSYSSALCQSCLLSTCRKPCCIFIMLVTVFCMFSMMRSPSLVMLFAGLA